MKKALVLFLVFVLSLNLSIPAFATNHSQPISAETTVLENGTVVTNEVFERATAARANYKTQVRRTTVTRSDVVIAILEFEAIYNYDGSTVYVVSKQITQTDTYDGWTFTKNSFTQSGGTVTLTGTLSKWLSDIDVTMTMTCDKNGNITYT